MVSQILFLQIRSGDRSDAIIERKNDCGTDQNAQVDPVDRLAIIEEVSRRVYVGPCVRPEMNARHIGTRTARDRLLKLDGNFRISRVDESTGFHGN